MVPMRRQPAEISWAELSFSALLLERAPASVLGMDFNLPCPQVSRHPMGNLIDRSRRSAFSLSVGIADSTGMRLLAFLA